MFLTGTNPFIIYNYYGKLYRSHILFNSIRNHLFYSFVNLKILFYENFYFFPCKTCAYKFMVGTDH